MSDIDFDELDRAVNGALGSNDALTPIVSTPTVEETPESTEPATINRVERTQLSPVSSQPTSVTISIAPAARRSSGRFMDMVHPSSDMRSQDRGAAVTAKPVVAPAVKEESTPEYVESPAWNEPLESPFLPDAKVEKRPLGGGEAISDKTGITDAFDFEGLLDEPEEELLEAPEPQERLEAIASPDPIDFAAATAINDEREATSFVVEEPVKEESVDLQQVSVEPEAIVEQPQPVEAITEAPQPVLDEPVGPTSITPQYKEQPSSNQESGAMYDTESYHQAVTAPVKKKSGWFTVLWIVLLVVFGAGAGYTVYTYVLPML